jgi:predicted hydrocarbon binding protein
MPEQEKTVTNISIRSVYDSLSEIMGENARNMIFRRAGLERVISSPPEYTWDREFTYDEQLCLYTRTIELVGPVGAQGILRRMGYKSANFTIEKFHILESIIELPPKERFVTAMDFLTSAIGRGRVADSEGELPNLDVFDCTFCTEVASTKPYCGHYNGVLQYLADWCFEKGAYIVREIRCRALGDDTCCFSLTRL